tara:strand:+ start:379 stop:567 length:189 start_codon:yes stop_codon:yes gene_type:complete
MNPSKLAHKISSILEKELDGKVFEHETYVNGMGCQFRFYLKDKSFMVDLWDEDVVNNFNTKE